MISVLISFLVTAAFFGVAVVMGFRLERSAKPYPIDWLLIHIAMFVPIILGIGACMNAIEPVLHATSLAIVSLCFAGPALLALLVTGSVMILSKQKKRGWILLHKLAMYSVAVSTAAAGILTMLKR